MTRDLVYFALKFANQSLNWHKKLVRAESVRQRADDVAFTLGIIFSFFLSFFLSEFSALRPWRTEVEVATWRLVRRSWPRGGRCHVEVVLQLDLGRPHAGAGGRSAPQTRTPTNFR